MDSHFIAWRAERAARFLADSTGYQVALMDGWPENVHAQLGIAKNIIESLLEVVNDYGPLSTTGGQ